MPCAPRTAAFLTLAAALACASGPRIEGDPTYEWPEAASWDWLPLTPDESKLSDLELRNRIGDAIARELAERGLRRSDAPDLRVACWIARTRERVLRTEATAARFLPSLHAGEPSYEITGSQRRVVHYERVILGIAVFDARSQSLVWQGQLEERVRGRFLERAERAVARLLARFPRLEARPQGGDAARDRSA